ncbi:MAG: hypothetical protein D6812_16525, partial [Deltaproteobacteria bacterium]
LLVTPLHLFLVTPLHPRLVAEKGTRSFLSMTPEVQDISDSSGRTNMEYSGFFRQDQTDIRHTVHPWVDPPASEVDSPPHTAREKPFSPKWKGIHPPDNA